MDRPISELALHRLLRGLSQCEVARAAGLLPNALSRYERGRRRPKPEIVARILAAIEELAAAKGSDAHQVH